MNSTSLESIMMRLLKYLSIALVILVPIILIFGQRAPSVSAVPPPADLIALAGANETYGDEPATDDFVTRPLLRASRKPLVAIDEVAESVAPEVQPEPEPEKLDEAVLKGVFVSGDTQGVIIGAGPERHRILVGEKYKEWVLQSVEPRAAVFAIGRAGRVRNARIEMEIATSVTPASRDTPRRGRRSGGDSSGSTDEGDNNASSGENKDSGSVMGRLTFEKMYGEKSPKKGDKE